MSYCDEVPIPHEAHDWNPDGDEEREFMEDVFKSITRFDHDRRHFHNRDGWYAEEAFSEKCLALGHREEDGDDPHYADGDHSYGWDGSMLCEGTKWGIACTECQGECDYLDDAPIIWEMKGVLADA